MFSILLFYSTVFFHFTEHINDDDDDDTVPTLKPQSNEPLHSNTVIGYTGLAVGGWAVTFGTWRRGLGGLGLRSVPPLLAVTNVTGAHPSTAIVPTYLI